MKKHFNLAFFVIVSLTLLASAFSPVTSPLRLTTPLFQSTPTPTSSPAPLYESSVHKALMRGDMDTVVALIEENPSLINSREEHLDQTPLHIAVWLANPKEANRSMYVPIVKWLLEHGADVNAIAYNEFTPLHLASNGEVARLLIQYGANLDQVDGLGETPLQDAANEGKNEVINAILKSGYPMDIKTAIILGERERVIELVQEDPTLVRNQVDGWSLWEETSPLGLAAARGDLELVELFLANGAPVNAITYMPMRGNATPLSNAVWGSHEKIVRTLCAHGADPNLATGGKYDHTIFDYAINYSGLRIIWDLVQCGAKPSSDTRTNIINRLVSILLKSGLVIIIVGSVIGSVVLLRKRRKQSSRT